MEQYAGLDVSLEQTSVCIVDGTGRIVREAKVASEPEALLAWFAAHGVAMTRIGLEAGPLSQWLFAGMEAAGLPVSLLETQARPGRPQDHDHQDRPQRCAGHRASDANGVVPRSSLQVAGGPGGSSPAESP